MFDWVIGGLGDLFGFGLNAIGEAVGWAWDKVVTGIYTWLANGLALLVEWVWSVLDSGTTPRVTAGWFANDLAVQLGVLALAVTVAMMLASGIQAALAGRPEQILDAVRQGMWSIVASALTVTVIDLLLGLVDEASAMVWQSGRADLVSMIEGIVVVATTTGPLTAAQASLMRVLWEQQGLPLRYGALLTRAKVGVERPVHAFQKQKYPDANRAYHALVCSDRKGRYWIERSADT